MAAEVTSPTRVEHVHWPAWLHAAGAGAAAVAAAAAARLLATEGARVDGAVLAALLAGLLALWWRMRKLVVAAGPEGVRFGYGRPRRYAARDRIVEARAEAYSFREYLGWGYRIGWRPHDRAYAVLGHTRGLRIEFLDERGRRWSIHLSSKDPEALVRALKGSAPFPDGVS